MGEQATRWTIRLALLLAVLALGSAVARTHRSSSGRTRALWTAACLSYLAHVACAFHFFHHWSHAAAYRRTALDTASIVGFEWGGGLYLNYLFTALWIGDVAWWWLNESSFLRRPAWLSRVWHIWFVFIAFNGAVVFVQGPALAIGLLLSIVTVGLVLYRNNPWPMPRNNS